METFTVKIQPLPKIWTGDANKNNTDPPRETGIIGSLRWWYEALIRGLGGTACDPTSTKCANDIHCDACELFGCTGWARKFRLEIEKSGENYLFKFVPLREIKDVEWALLNNTIKIISNYGAIGGKLSINKYGVINLNLLQNGLNDLDAFNFKNEELITCLKKKGSNTDNPNLLRFFFLDCKNVSKSTVIILKNNLSFLKGTIVKGKKYFYKTDDKGKICRFFVYGEDDEQFNKIKEHLTRYNMQYKTGRELLKELK